MRSIDLNKNWCIRRSGDATCFYADVPATVIDVLYKNGEIPDPYFGENEWDVYEVLKKDHVFTNTFEVKAEDLEAEQLLLECKGLDTIADIYINDQWIAFADDMHRTYEYDVKKYLTEGLNHIKILFHSNLQYALEQHAKEPYYSTYATVDGFSLVRKAHFSYGWDWGPKLPDMGIWREIGIKGYEAARLSDIYIRQGHGADEVKLSFVIDVEKYREEEVDLQIMVTTPEGDQITREAHAVKGKDTYELSVSDPRLWWCHGFGEQPLYRVEILLLQAGKVIDRAEKRIGLRTLTIRREKDQWGESFEFCLNGVSVFAMGADYIPEDGIYPRCSRERTEKLIRQCIRANYNSIRVWGGGYFCDDHFYDLCDEYGLLVWQDLMFACGVYRLHKDFVENVIKETEDNVKRLRHHACIGLWCGNNELEWGWSGWDMGFGDRPSDKSDYIKLFEWILPETVRAIDPDRFYWLASPSSGGSFDDPNDENRGDVHYWDVWHRLKHFTEYRKHYFRFCSEFGFQSFPSLKTIRSFSEKEDENIFSPVMENHQKNKGANGLILYYLSSNFLYPSDFSTLVYVSQILQAEAIRYGVEHWRSNRGRCMGSLYWQVNDCWPVASWSSIDYYYRWKPLHYYAKKFYAPILLSALEENGIVRFVISNETRSHADLKVVWRLRDHEGNLLEEGTAEDRVLPLTAKEIRTVDYSQVSEDRARSRSQYLEYLLFCGQEELSCGTLLFCRPKHFQFRDPKITYSVSEREDAFLITLKTENYAKYVTLDADTFDFVASDNCFDISKGEEKVIEIRKEDITRDSQQASVSISDFDLLTIRTAHDIK